MSTITQKSELAIAEIDSTKGLFAYVDPEDSNKLKTLVFTVSGTDVTVGASTTVTTSTQGVPSIAALDSSRVALFVSRPTELPGGHAGLFVGTVTGTDVTWAAPASLSDVRKSELRKLDTDKLVLSSSDFGVIPQIMVITVSGTTATQESISNVTGWEFGGSFKRAGIAVLDPSTILFADPSGPTVATDLWAVVGKLGLESDLVATTPGAYPAASGNDRVVMAMWANKLGAGTSVFTAQRDFTVVLDATSISLGPATSVWSSVAVATLMGTTMAGGEHFLVLDFENTSGGDWTLNTSLDGAVFVAQGTQTSGTRTTSPATLAPGLSLIPNGETGQWVDELVMWSGDKNTFVSFTTQELANLQDLADVFGATMNQFEQNFGAPLCWQATANMPDGSVWRDSGSGPCPPVVRVPKGADDIMVTDDGQAASPRIIEG